MNETFNLDHHILSLLQDEPFFAALSRRINKRSTSQLPTAGVRVNPDTAQFEMLYNPDFFQKLTKAQRKDVLKHEFYHLIFEHVTSRKPEDINPRVWNFATDLAINSHLDNLPEGCLMPGVGHFEDFPKGLSAEHYLSLLLKKQEENKESGDGDGEGGSGDGLPEDGQFDSHDEWADSTPEGSQAADIAKERIKDFVKKSAEEAMKQGSSGWGSVPSDVRKDIMERLVSRVDWRKALQYFVKTSRRASRSSTVKRVNKRYRYIHPGKKVKRRAKLAVSIDMSGSVCDNMMALFFSELEKLTKLVSITVVPFDTRVEDSLIYEWKQGASHKFERVMNGGTDFNAPTKWVNDKGFDGHIVLTDMMAPKPVASKCQRMWVTTSDCLRYQHFQTNERIIVVDK